MHSFFMRTTRTGQTARMNLGWAHMSDGTFSHMAGHMSDLYFQKNVHSNGYCIKFNLYILIYFTFCI